MDNLPLAGNNNLLDILSASPKVQIPSFISHNFTITNHFSSVNLVISGKCNTLSKKILKLPLIQVM